MMPTPVLPERAALAITAKRLDLYKYKIRTGFFTFREVFNTLWKVFYCIRESIFGCMEIP